MLYVSIVYQNVYTTSIRYQNEQQNCTEKCIMLCGSTVYQKVYTTSIMYQSEQQKTELRKCIMLYVSIVYQYVCTTSIMYQDEQQKTESKSVPCYIEQCIRMSMRRAYCNVAE
jgi:hypothetical protein